MSLLSQSRAQVRPSLPGAKPARARSTRVARTARSRDGIQCVGAWLLPAERLLRVHGRPACEHRAWPRLRRLDPDARRRHTTPLWRRRAERGGSGGTGAECDVRFCPNFGFGQPCCVSRDGPCGFNFGGGCISIGRDGGPGAGGTAGGGAVDAGPPGQVSCGNGASVCTSGQKCCVTSVGPDTCTAVSATCVCPDAGACTVTDIGCDGPEDCPNGACCAVFSQAQQRYLRAECQPSCSAQQLEFQMCHQGGSCPPGQTCSNSQFLPPNLRRCN